MVISAGQFEGCLAMTHFSTRKSAKDSAERFLTDQAYLENGYTKVDTPIGIHQGGVMDRPATTAKVVSRFAKL